MFNNPPSSDITFFHTLSDYTNQNGLLIMKEQLLKSWQDIFHNIFIINLKWQNVTNFNLNPSLKLFYYPPIKATSCILRALALENANAKSKGNLTFSTSKQPASGNGKQHYCKFFCNSATVQFYVQNCTVASIVSKIIYFMCFPLKLLVRLNLFNHLIGFIPCQICL